MNLNQGKRNKQAVQVLNKVEYDSEGNPIGMMEDPSNPASANFGTPREPRRGGCYLGNGSAYITITGLLSTDTIEVMGGSDLPTISNDRLDIASGDKVFGVKVFRAGELWGKYNCSENSGTVAYDSSGNGNHGQIINAITTTPEENPNSIHQYQDVYSFENEEGYSESGSVLIPKNSSITLPPFKDVLGNNLQYVSKVPGKAKFVNSSCFKHTTDTGNTGLKFKTNVSVLFYEISFTVLPTPSSGSVFYSFASGLYGYYGNTVRIFGASPSLAVPPPTIGKLMYIKIRRYENWFGVYHNNILVGTYTGTHNNITNMVLSHIGRGATASGFSLGGNIWNFKITELDSLGNYVQTLGHWPLCEPIIDPSNHIYHDVSGNGNHATLINGTLANNGKQDKFHYLQRGLKNDGVNQIIPILDDGSGFADGSLLTDENAIQQDSFSFLNTGTELEAYDYPALKQADKDNNFWYIGDAGVRRVSHYELAIENLMSDKIFLDRTDKNI